MSKMVVTDMIEIFIPLEKIPSATAQEKGYRVIRGKVVTYEKEKVKEVRQLYQSHLCHHAPNKPMDGPVLVQIDFIYHKDNLAGNYQYKTTSPDVDNMAKLLIDVMTECKYWHDDGQVAKLLLTKYWCQNENICGIHIKAMTKWE
jgi:Holliday junction resolvase RusA-like endonuclease